MLDEHSTELKWYILHTYSGYENKVKTTLEKLIENRGIQDMISDVRVPMETVETTTASGEAKTKEEKLFPSYVLVKMMMTDETWHIVRNITGATGFVGPGSRPVPLPDAEVEALGVDTKTVTTSFAVGDNVKIKNGPMANFEGTISAVSADCKTVTVLASVFGRETPVELDAQSIEKI